MIHWDDNQPIYQQLKEKITISILDGDFAEGEAIPSIRQVSSDYRINPITVSKAYQMLADEKIIEKKRGLGMYVITGARKRLLALEQKRFMQAEWPKILQRIKQLGLNIEELVK